MSRMSTIDDQLHREHHLIDRLCNDLCETLTDRNIRKAKRMLRQLRELVNSHFTAEELDWFPRLTAHNPRLKARADELMADHVPLRRMLEEIATELDCANNERSLFLCERLLRTMRGHAQQEELLLPCDTGA